MSLLLHFGRGRLNSSSYSSSLMIINQSIKLLNCTNGVRWLPTNFARTYLSAQYDCEDLWNKRFENSSLKHITPDRYFFELNQRYQQKKKVSAVDVDIYANSVSIPDNQHELEHILRQFRKSRLTVDTHQSTHHAVCRFYLSNSKKNTTDDPLFRKLLEILNQRIEYGIFPDQFIYNLLLDRAVVCGDLERAGLETTKLMMLQEDSGNEISRTLALYILSQLLEQGKIGPETIWGTGAAEESVEPEQEEVDEDEIEYIRVPYLSNKYFDDHFDLNKRSSLFGKSLYFFGHEIGLEQSESTSNQLLSLSSRIIGLIYYEKWSKLNRILDRCDENNRQITSDVSTLIQQCLQCETITDESKLELNQLNEKLSKSFTIVPGVLIGNLIEKRLENLPKLESHDIAEMERLFVEFEKTRIQSIDSQLERLLQLEREKELEQKKKELQQKQRLYYFFENFPQHEIDFVEAEKRINEIRSNTVVDEDYMPPETY